jgi:photosystem II stability/assembly factor-like uncharacterized protein
MENDMQRTLTCVIVGLGLIAAVAPARAAAQSTSPVHATLDQLEWRHIGPANFGGRIDDIEAVPSRPATIFVGAAGGGLWRSLTNGVTWTPVLDAVAGSISIGDIAIAPSDPNVIWVGTGEANSRQSSTWGDGVYRSLDGGTTWTHMGLRDSQHIGRIVIHPRDPDVVFVAALGHLWGPNPERGLYRTRDGGQTWQKVLGVDDNTGVVDVAMDPDGRTMYAATYQRRRAGFGFVGGGPGSGLWRSLDGGETWTRLTDGLPAGPSGRIGIAIAPSHSDIVYAAIENRDGGVFRSDDRGGTWRRVSATDPRPMYYSQLRVDPANPDRVWMLGTNIHRSIDGGKTFTTDGTGDRIHVDHHALWIDPSNPDHMMLGNDGGLHFTYDGAKNWDYINNLPIGQFYDVDVDGRDPYWLYGGAQDNGSWAIPSRTTALIGITGDDVLNLAYGDGFYATTDATNPRWVFANSQNGRAYRVDLETREERGIRPVPADSRDTLRWNWTTPQLRSPHDPSLIYYGAQKLFQTRDAGQTWQTISPDLTRNLDWRRLPLMGTVRDSTTLSLDDGIDAYGTITSIAESAVRAGTLLIGTDDGNVQMTTNGGTTWTNLTDRFRLPGPRWVSRVLFSKRAGTAYVAFDGHQDDDMTPRLFRTSDGGASWVSIAGDLPAGNVVRALAEDPRNPDILFAGTEFGLWLTYNGGRNWVRAGGNLPRVRVDDVLYNEATDDLVLATHGRSFIILDDVRLLENGDPMAVNRPLVLAPIRPATQTYMQRMLPMPGARTFAGPNPPEGALITYTVNSTNAKDSVLVTITDGSGRTVRSLAGPSSRGVHRLAWDLHYARVDGVTDADEGWFGPPRGPWVLPGNYTVRVEGARVTETGSVEVRPDPRIDAPPAALVARNDIEMRLQSLLRTFVEGSRLWDAMSKERVRIDDAVTDSTARTAIDPALKDLGVKLDSLGAKFRPGFGGPKFRYLDLDGSLQASSTAPTDAQARELDALAAQLAEDIGRLNAVLAGEFAELQRRAAGGVALKPVRMVGT